MKIRNGFVSNSSSASYIVKIDNESIEDFCYTIANEFTYDLFCVRDILEKVSKSINDCLQPDHDSYYKGSMAKYWKGIDDVERQLEQDLKKFIASGDCLCDCPELVTDILNHYHRLHTKYSDGKIVLEASTSMHNSIEDVPAIMKSIIALYIFNHPDKHLECIVDQD